MAYLEKLKIQGIRSYGVDSPAVIKFDRPLTLIIGANGSGKTTIIESIKVALTGVIPAMTGLKSKAGQAFVHDPQVSDKTPDTKALIKLQFRNRLGESLTCSRRFTLTHSDKSAKFKTNESALEKKKSNNEVVRTSNKCLDLDTAIPLELGVSKAILDNVIFVHQEEANWPLEDPGSLRKKFDDIFEATRYTQALEAIKRQKNELQSKLKDLDKEKSCLQLKKEEAEKLKSHFDLNKRSVEKFNAEMQEISQKIEERKEQIGRIEAQEVEVIRLEREIDMLKSQREVVEKQVMKFREDIGTPCEEPISELQAKDAELLRREEQLKDVRQRRSDLERELADLDRRLGNIVQEKSNLNAQVSRREEALENVYNLAREASRHAEGCAAPSRHDLHQPDTGTNFVKALTENCDRTKARLDRFKDTNARESSRLFSKIEAQKVAIAETEVRIKNDREKLADYTKRMAELRADAERFSSLRQDLESAQAALLQSRDSLSRLSESEKESEVTLQASEERMQTLEKKRDELQTDLHHLRDSRTKAELHNQRKSEYQTRKEKLQTRLLEVKEALLPVIHSIPDQCAALSQTLNAELEDRLCGLAELKSAVDEKVALEKGVSARVRAVEVEMDDVKETIKKCEVELRKVSNASSRQFEFSKLFDKARETLLAKQRRVNVVTHQREFYEEFLTEGLVDGCCPLCKTSMTDEAKQAFQTTCEEGKNTEATLAEANKQLDRATRTMARLEQEIRPHFDKYTDLVENRLPKLEADLGPLETQLQQVQQEVLQCKAQRDDLDSEINVLRKLAPTVDHLAQEESDLEGLKLALEVEAQEWQELEQSKNPILIQEALTKCETQRNELKAKLELQKSEMQNIRLKQRQMQADVGNKAEQVQVLQAGLDRAKRASEEATALKKTCEELSASIQMVSSSIQTDRSVLDVSTREFEEKKVSSQREERRLTDKWAELSSSVETIRSAVSQLSRYLEDHLEAQLDQAADEELELSSKRDLYREQHAEVVARGSKTQEIERQRALIRENIRYQAEKERLEGILMQLSSLEEELAKKRQHMIATCSADSKQALVQELSSLQQQVAKLDGAKSVCNANRKRAQAELRENYATIEEDFQQAVVYYKTQELLVKDEDMMVKALDRGLSKFHKMKMSQINDLIRETWENVYQNPDIDYIKIKSDDTGDGRTRTYNYRVVMQKGSMEMDMRGRCSAGQKVLASIVIRLALAEAFCLNCGMLALDEPTTNLDTPNKESLARALGNLIRSRASQRNFQLLLITHDEAFVRALVHGSHSLPVDYFYRVMKPPQPPHYSVVTRHPLATENL